MRTFRAENNPSFPRGHLARINIEDSLWADARFLRFCVRTGDEARAVGLVCIAYRLAQKHWCPEKRPVPLALWEQAGLPEAFIECGLAERRPDGIYVRGSEDQFAWWFQRVNAGKKGGRPKGPAKRAKAGANRMEPGAKRLEPSSSSSSSSSNTQNEESIGMPAVADSLSAISAEMGLGRASQSSVQKAEQAKKTNQFVGAYVKAYQTRFPGSRPEDLNDGRVRGQIVAWMKGYPLERACQLIQVYFQMEARWFGTKGYDFLTFRNNLNKIGQALDSGKDPDGASVDWAKVFGGAS